MAVGAHIKMGVGPWRGRYKAAGLVLAKLWLLTGNPPHVRYIAKEAELASELWRHNISIIAAVIIQHWGLRCGGVGGKAGPAKCVERGQCCSLLIPLFILVEPRKFKIMRPQPLEAEKRRGLEQMW